MSNYLTEVRLLSVPLENDYKHTLAFLSKAKQSEYFISKTATLNGAPLVQIECSYQRKEKIIRYPACVDDIQHCNYVMYKNKAHSNNWVYAFITKKEYKNDELTEISIETDVMQTYLDDYKIRGSFVEREHVDNDKIGLHTYPEQLETGEFIINSMNKNGSLLVNSLIIATTVDLNNFDDTLVGNGKYKAGAGARYAGIYSGLKYYQVTTDEANKAIKALAETGQSDAIVAIFTCPSLFVKSTQPTDNENAYAEVNPSDSANRVEWVNTLGLEGEKENYKPDNLDGYVPKNNKLFTYPYCYMLMSNNSGASAVYKYELFNNPNDEKLCSFYIYSAITPSFSICITPRHYNNVDINNLEQLPLGKFPVCAWTTDVYTNWLTQNAVNIPLSIGTALVTTGLATAGALLSPATGGLSAMATVGAISAGVSGATSIASTLGEMYQHSLQPPQAEGNINSGDVTFATGNLTFTAYHMTIKKEYARIIDEYFNMYGYKVCRVTVPLVYHRENYWYTKTREVNIDGNIPAEDMEKIKSIYNNGVTFWKNPENIGNYLISNNIVE